jgi:hypothetical protein
MQGEASGVKCFEAPAAIAAFPEVRMVERLQTFAMLTKDIHE